MILKAGGVMIRAQVWSNLNLAWTLNLTLNQLCGLASGIAVRLLPPRYRGCGWVICEVGNIIAPLLIGGYAEVQQS